MNTRLSLPLVSCAAGMKWMSSQGYSAFLALGSGLSAGFTTRTYIAASDAGAPFTSRMKGTKVRCSCDLRKNGVIVNWMSVGAGCPAITPSTTLTIASISCCSCLLRFLVSGLADCASANVPDRATATARATTRRMTIIKVS